MHQRGLGMVVALTSSLLACGPSTPAGDSAAGGSATAADGGSATAADGGSGPATSSADATGADASADDGDVCSQWDNVQGSVVALQVVNQSAAPIFLQRNGCADPIGLVGPDGAGPTAVEFPDCRFAACADVVSGDCVVACSGGGGGACQATAVRVDPGATYERVWAGAVWETTALAASCVMGGCAPECHHQVEAAAGAYALSVSYSPCPNLDPADCACPAGESTCEIIVDRNAPSPMPQFVSVDFTYPDQLTPQIVAR